MGNIMFRMGLVITILVGVQLGFMYLGRLGNPEVIELQQPLTAFPLSVRTPVSGTWEGKAVTLDERQFNESQVDVAVTRAYTNREGRLLKFLLAEYKQPSTGLYHNPMNCYRANGFAQLERVRRPLKTANRPDTEVDLTTWDKGGERVLVAYWYEVGDHTLFERQDLLPTQWAMFGKTQWPVMLKVLLEVPVKDTGDLVNAQTDIMEMAQVVREWLGMIKPALD